MPVLLTATTSSPLNHWVMKTFRHKLSLTGSLRRTSNNSVMRRADFGSNKPSAVVGTLLLADRRSERA
jgi:hypothetical protein